MSTKTKNYQFVKPEENEFYDINISNANWDIADAELKRRVLEDGDISGTQVSTLGSIFEEFPVPVAGDTTKTIIGKIKKFFEDFKNLKSSLLLVNQVVNNCTTDRGDLPGAAAQLKVLMDLYTKLNSDLTGVRTSVTTLSSDKLETNAFNSHKSSGDHDSRYYTESEINTKLNAKSDSSHNHDNKYWSNGAAELIFQGWKARDTNNELIVKAPAVSFKNIDQTSYIPLYAKSFNTSSSIRYKDSIKEISEDEAKNLLGLVPHKFDYINGDKEQYGFIAEELAEIQEQGLIRNKNGYPEAIDYSKFVPQILKLIQLQEQRIQKLEISK